MKLPVNEDAYRKSRMTDSDYNDNHNKDIDVYYDGSVDMIKITIKHLLTKEEMSCWLKADEFLSDMIDLSVRRQHVRDGKN